MIHILLITHGDIATELIASATRIVGDLLHTRALRLGWDDDPEATRRVIRAAVDELGGDDTLLILTDMFGGTPTNLALAFMEPSRVEVVTGVNLPMLLKVASREAGETVAEVARKARAEGRRSIYIASEVLAKTEPAAS